MTRLSLLGERGVCLCFLLGLPLSPLHVCTIDLYRAMLKQKIFHGKLLIQSEARCAKTKLFVLLGLKMAAV